MERDECDHDRSHDQQPLVSTHAPTREVDLDTQLHPR